MAEYEIRDRHHISSPGNLTKGNDLKKTGETSDRRGRTGRAPSCRE